MQTINFQFTTDYLGSPCVIEVECAVHGQEWSVEDAHLVHILPYNPRRLLSEGPPDFTACRDLNLRLDASEVAVMFDREIQDELPKALREAEAAAQDSYLEEREMDFISGLHA